MPAGVSWTTYLKFTISGGLSMFAGSQVVHAYYRPLQDLDAWINNYKNFLNKGKPSKQIDSSEKQVIATTEENAEN